MEHFQKKISQMRQAINSIKLDIESAKSTSNFREIKKSKSHAFMPLTTKLLNDNPVKLKRKSVYTHFKDNCPLKKEQLAREANSTSAFMKSNLTNYSKTKQYNFNYPLNSTLNKKAEGEMHPYGKLSDYVDTHREKHEASLQPFFKSKERNKLFNISSETKRISTNQSTISSQRRQLNHLNADTDECFRKIPYRSFKNGNEEKRMGHRRYMSNNPNENYQDCGNGDRVTDIVDELVDMTNSHFNGKVVTPTTFIPHYRKMMNQMKMKDEFIDKLFLMFNKASSNKRINDEENYEGNCHLLSLYKWIQYLSYSHNYTQTNSDKGHNKEPHKGNYYNERKRACSTPKNDYQQLCERIMKQYKIKDMKDFMLFLDYLLKKANCNENYLEAIKKILLSEKRLNDN